MASVVRGPWGELSFEVEQIDVTSGLPYPDERWTYTDHHGHEHYRRDGGYPTLTWIVDETYWCGDCDEEHTEGHWECSICGERIEPGISGPDAFRKVIRGRRSYYLNGEPITEERFQEIRASMQP